MNIFESNTPHSGDRETDAGHRRIELQSPADLKYIIANVSRTAREKIDKHLPPDAAPEGEDAMRKRVAELVDDYIKNTFAAAKDSLSINGLSSLEMESELAKAQEGQEIEAFDTKLAQRLQALAAQIDHQTLQLANLRKTAPTDTAKKYQREMEKAEIAHDAEMARVVEEKVAMAREMEVRSVEVEGLEEMERVWRRGIETVEELKGELGSTVERVERAKRAVEVLGE
ncbi:Kinetochore protein Mis14 like [Teratosphaeria destructans]|uniref:Kinetochore protein Mis14 like n=1 Tax=Teratosphaeria destructans TaxID=418781 RepID=A0A9W7W259_9PEZI|nr:Kinetochore protein Mis14 like [Teratosphaeria destructans]